MNNIRLRQLVTLVTLGVALIHILWPDLAIDGITLALLVIALVPWLAPIFRSLELPGGLKVEFQELQKAAERVDDAGLLETQTKGGQESIYIFETIADLDPNLALAGLRIEIEKRLTELAEKHGIGTRMQGLGRMMKELAKKQVLTSEQSFVLADMIELLNKAVHGASVDERATQWAMDIGPRLLESLDRHIRKSV